jgi:hypothetical protein
MAVYNFKKEAKLYLVKNGLKYSLDIYPDVSVSQTFNETSVPVKTLHSQFDMFESAVITSANTANFSFTIPLLYENDMNIVLEILRDWDSTSVEASLQTADFYLETASVIYKLKKAVIESGVFDITRNSLILLNLSGTASKLQKVVSIPGTLQVRSSTRTFGAPERLEVIVGGTTLTSIVSVSMELQNEVQWLNPKTLQNSLNVTDASNTQYFEDFVVSKRTLSGSVQQYLTDENSESVNTWSTGTSLSIKTGNTLGGWLLEFILPSVVYTNRLDTQEIFTQSFDFRLNSNAANLSTVIILN